MCGIAGVLYADSGRTVDPEVLSAMGDAIAHRGPDGHGVFRTAAAALIHRRLAIIDPNGGQQPISNEDESIHVVFNGEIYNYRVLRTELENRGHTFRTHSDTEVLVHLYEEYGHDLCRHLRGMFAFAIWDARRKDLFLARDHLGQKPLFIYRDARKLVFGSELKAILAHPEIDRSIDPYAIEDYLTFGFIPGQRSIFSRISKLPAGHRLHASGTRLQNSPERYWQLSFDHEDNASCEEWTQRIDSALKESVAAHLVADVPVGAFLSGGVDSSAIVAMMAELQSEPVRTFSIGFHESRYSELPFAREVAQHFGCHHTEEIVTPEAARDLDDLAFLYDEPFADASTIPTMAVSRLAARHLKVVLSGDGGDELFGGYSRYAHDLKEARIRRWIPSVIRSLVLRPMAAIWPRADWLPRPLRIQTALQNLSLDPASAYANTVSICRSSVRSTLLNQDYASRIRGYEPEQTLTSEFRRGHRDDLSGMLSADTAILLPDDFLTKVDRGSMGFGLEVRTPLIDWKLMELVASMPSEFKIRRGSKKWILKHLFAPRLPNNLVHRRKQGFEIPVNEWLRGPLREQVQSSLLRPDCEVGQFLDLKTIRRLYEHHRRGLGQHGQLLWSLLVLARWLNTWGNATSDLPIRSHIHAPSRTQRSAVLTNESSRRFTS